MTFSFFKKRPDAFDYVAERVCKNCENAFRGKFCNRCGEKVIDAADRSFGRMAESILNAFTFLEGKFWRTFTTLIRHPGQLSARIREGVQVPYMRVVGLFFVANFFYFLFPFYDSFTTPLAFQMTSQRYSGLVQAIVQDEVNRGPLNLAAFTEAYNAHTTSLSKLLLVVLVFLFSAPLAALNYSKKNYFLDHLQVSFEFHAFLLLLNMVLGPLMFATIIHLVDYLFGWDWRMLGSESFYKYITILLCGYFFVQMQRIFYSDRWWVAALKSSVLVVLVFVSWQIYRLLLFLATFYTL